MAVSENPRPSLPPPSIGDGILDDADAGQAYEVSAQTTWMLAVRDNRDRRAFADLFDHYAPLIKGFAIRGGARASVAEVIVQEVMVTVWHRAALFDPHRGTVSAWIYQIARNKQVDHFRRTRRPVPQELAEDPELEADSTHIVAVRQETERLKAALARLSPNQRETIERAFLGEMTHEEISTDLGLPLGTIKSRIRLGLERLRHELKGLR